MPERRKRRRVRDKWLRKSWFTIIAPSNFGGVEIGETAANEPDAIVGRVVEASLFEITNNFEHQYVTLRFKITKVDGEVARTMFKGHEHLRDYLRSLTRRQTSKIDYVQDVITKDGYKLRIYSTAITQAKIGTTVASAVRKAMHKVIEEGARARVFDEFVYNMVMGRFDEELARASQRFCWVQKSFIYKSKLLAPID